MNAERMPITWIDSPAVYEAMTAKEQSEYRAAVKARHYAGDRVEVWDHNLDRWVACGIPTWSWSSGSLYRIAKPKPMELWEWVLIGGARTDVRGTTERVCRMLAESQGYSMTNGRAVCFVEKLKEG